MGPLVGGFAVQYAPVKGGFTSPWTWPIWELMWLSGFCLVYAIPALIVCSGFSS
jgi:DHA1 family multidrug resistance protein-like MFS transporter